VLYGALHRFQRHASCPPFPRLSSPLQTRMFRRMALSLITARREARAAVAAAAASPSIADATALALGGTSRAAHSPPSSKTLLDLLLDASEGSKAAPGQQRGAAAVLSDEELLDNAVTFLFAGVAGGALWKGLRAEARFLLPLTHRILPRPRDNDTGCRVCHVSPRAAREPPLADRGEGAGAPCLWAPLRHCLCCWRRVARSSSSTTRPWARPSCVL
jgi:hypothetical protein